MTSDQTCVVLRGRLRALMEAGFDVIVVSSPGHWLTSVAETEGVSVVPIPMRRAVSPWRDAIAFFRLCRLIARLRPEITDFSTPKCGLLGTIAAWLMRVPRRVYTLRGLRLESSHGLERWVLWWAERISCWCSNVVLCNSLSLKDAAIVCGIAPAEKLVVLGRGSTSGVDTERFSPGESDVRKQFGIPVDTPVVGFVGRITGHKGIPELMEAFHEVQRRRPGCWLLLTGWFDRSEDALDERLRREIESHPRVLVTGSVDDPPPYYRAMDVFVLPTHREGFPNAALEAAACGLPVITTCATGARNAVIDGETGYLIPVRSSAAIAEAILRLISDEGLRKKLGRGARAWAVEHYERRNVLKRVVGFYRLLLTPEWKIEMEGMRVRATSANPADFGEVGDVG
ncbi:glycosyltransferase family 4 protein [Acidicapsa dinghuensis]|uniref:Glycosyltransferase family 4 protein n=1 Tax=Acidicapsa dinghuensis TaxID=2218256 RepID=A0ABW1EKU0_9BACT|nr:glycosyltransferase family 4 protein [Acidicapsa dinghuensis]